MKQSLFALFVLVLTVAGPQAALACSVCYGEPDSPVTQGLTWAITALGALVVCVLAGCIAFFVQANRKATVMQATDAATSLIEKD